MDVNEVAEEGASCAKLTLLSTHDHAFDLDLGCAVYLLSYRADMRYWSCA